MTLQSRIEAAISSSTHQEAIFIKSKTAHGGCINDSRIVTTKDGRQFFIKTHPQVNSFPRLFETEFKALQLLAEPDVIHVPKPIAYDDDFIVMDVFNEGRPAKDWQEQMGRCLAQLHLATKKELFGFADDNYIGTTTQLNNWNDSWLDFWREQRLAYQLKLFSKKTNKDDLLLQTGERLINKLDSIIGDVSEPAVLLHGDLWSGNAAANEQGQPIMFDPASYYGHREAEIGMMRLFGGFGSCCESAYAEIWPLEEGAERRISLYRLYHELNHLNLFGQSYYQTCLSTINSLI
ncbi:MAG TPA: fructosamine kinase [Thiotrichaceae bacterium]|jgi:fructosamine-3-kinase|nr:fructosamine kinase [Thiotrichaceae bacterium]HIM07061.1 fructosamine kinase [Gammaproteobacteria bacterium]